MPKIDLATAPRRIGIDSYPEPFRGRCAGVERVLLSRAAGLEAVGINLVTLAPGQITAIRHWHEREDELVFVVAGTVELISDAGAETLGPGKAAGFKAGTLDAHHFVNRGDAPATLLEIGPRLPDERVHYPDDDLALVRTEGASRFYRRDGTEY
ncbi:MAG: cupin domain-containing protein [Paracoccaceae bacterium]